jgi:hypothetical protein
MFLEGGPGGSSLIPRPVHEEGRGRRRPFRLRQADMGPLCDRLTTPRFAPYIYARTFLARTYGWVHRSARLTGRTDGRPR